MLLTIDGVGSLAIENGLQMPRFYPYLVELKPLSVCFIYFKFFMFYPYLVELKPLRKSNLYPIFSSFILT